MALENCYPVTINVCGDCVMHIAYGHGGGGCCHNGDHGDRPCPTGVRLERRWRDAEDITGGCTDEDCSGCESGWRAADCEGCGNGHGEQEHYTVWLKNDPRPVREITRNGWHVVIRPEGARQYAVATRGDDTRYLFDGPFDGSKRWQRMAEFVGTLAA